MAISQSMVKRTLHTLDFYRTEWKAEAPLRIHSNSVDEGHGLGGLAFNPAFLNWVGSVEHKRTDECKDLGCYRSRNSDTRTRATRNLRKLRREAPREFDVVYLICALGYTIDQTAVALTERAVRLGKPERYDPKAILLLAISGADKLYKWWTPIGQ